jgi:hypothetical protein
MSSNGSDGNDGNGQNFTGELVQWINPEKLEFKPTDRQKAFRRIARRMIANDCYFKDQWYRESTKSESEALKGHPVTPREWRQWCKEGRFGTWFFEDCAEVEPMSREELQMLDRSWWKGVANGMHEGEAWAFDKYAKVRFAKEEAGKATAEMSELKDYLGRGSAGDKWRLPSVEA